MATIIRLPMLVAGEETAVLTAWLANPGDEVGPDKPMVEIETEKASVEYEPEEEGIFAGALADLDAPVAVGAPIAVLAAAGEDLDAALKAGQAEAAAEGGAPVAAASETSDSAGAQEISDEARAAASAEANAAAIAPEEPASTPSADAVVPETVAEAGAAEAGRGENGRLFASPIVRKLAKESGVDLGELAGSGPEGRIVRRDLEAYLANPPAKAAAPAAPAAAPAKAAPAPAKAAASKSNAPGNESELVPLSGMRKAIARRLTESKTTVPHFYITADIRMDAALALRKQMNEISPTKISVNDMVIKAVAGALREVPKANAIWAGDAIEYFKHADISVAVSVEDGLVTPVLRGVDTMGIAGVSEKMKDYAARGREGKLKQDEIMGGSFSISNLGMYGTKQFNAILNPPQSAILAVGAASKQPVVNEAGEIEVASVMTVTLSADHRVIDGALAAEWVNAFKKLMENPMSILL